ncbi:alcohol acetyltransferase [Mycena leptocephala]|nr:alcohol acetyltransferase [Mycena leptocephala]
MDISPGLMEKYHATRCFLGMDTCVVASATYTTLEHTVLTKEVLFPALQTVIATHALLGARYDRRDDSLDLAYVRLPTVDLSRVVEFSGHRDLQEALRKQLSRRFEDTQGEMPLWRLEVLADNTVILAMHHGIGDGLSSAAFHNSLIRALQEPPLPIDSPCVVVPDVPVLPPIEDVTNIPFPLPRIVRALYSFLFQMPYAWTGNPVPAVAAIQTNIRLVSFEPSDVKKFSDICRAHSATVSSGMYELAVCALSRLIADVPARYTTLAVNVPISLRELAGGLDEICNYVSGYLTFPRIHTEFSWAVATSVAAELQVQKTKSIDGMGILRLVSSHMAGFSSGQLGKKRQYSLIISNLGRMQAPAVEGDWKMGNMFFGQCDSLAGPALGMNVVGDPAGGLNICVSWGEKSVDTAFVEAFITLFRESFHAL